MRRSWNGFSDGEDIVGILVAWCREELQNFARDGRLEQGAWLCGVPLHRARRAISEGEQPTLQMAVNLIYFSAIVPRRAFEGEPRPPNAAEWFAENPFLAPDISAKAQSIPLDDPKLGRLMTDLTSPLIEYTGLLPVLIHERWEREASEMTAYRTRPQGVYSALRAFYRIWLLWEGLIYPYEPPPEIPVAPARRGATLENESVKRWLLPPFVEGVRQIRAGADHATAVKRLAAHCGVSTDTARRTDAAMNEDGTWRRDPPSLPMLLRFRHSRDRFSPPLLEPDGMHGESLAHWLERNPALSLSGRAQRHRTPLGDRLVNGVLNDVLAVTVPLLAASRSESPEAAQHRNSATARFDRALRVYHLTGWFLSRCYPLLGQQPWQGVSFRRQPLRR